MFDLFKRLFSFRPRFRNVVVLQVNVTLCGVHTPVPPRPPSVAKEPSSPKEHVHKPFPPPKGGVRVERLKDRRYDARMRRAQMIENRYPALAEADSRSDIAMLIELRTTDLSGTRLPWK